MGAPAVSGFSAPFAAMTVQFAIKTPAKKKRLLIPYESYAF
jgi:hypothetical protein